MALFRAVASRLARPVWASLSVVGAVAAVSTTVLAKEPKKHEEEAPKKNKDGSFFEWPDLGDQNAKFPDGAPMYPNPAVWNQKPGPNEHYDPIEYVHRPMGPAVTHWDLKEVFAVPMKSDPNGSKQYKDLVNSECGYSFLRMLDACKRISATEKRDPRFAILTDMECNSWAEFTLRCQHYAGQAKPKDE